MSQLSIIHLSVQEMCLYLCILFFILCIFTTFILDDHVQKINIMEEQKTDTKSVSKNENVNANEENKHDQTW